MPSPNTSVNSVLSVVKISHRETLRNLSLVLPKPSATEPTEYTAKCHPKNAS